MTTLAAIALSIGMGLPSVAQSPVTLKPLPTLTGVSSDPDGLWTNPDDFKGMGGPVKIYRYQDATKDGTYLLSIIENEQCTISELCPGKLVFKPSSGGASRVMLDDMVFSSDEQPSLSADRKTLRIGKQRLPLGGKP